MKHFYWWQTWVLCSHALQPRTHTQLSTYMYAATYDVKDVIVHTPGHTRNHKQRRNYFPGNVIYIWYFLNN